MNQLGVAQKRSEAVRELNKLGSEKDIMPLNG